jgi:hypothetical protein
MTEPYEFDEVRKVAAEAFALLHPDVAMPLLGAGLEESLRDFSDMVAGKVLIYCLCNCLLLRPQHMRRYIPAVASLLLYILRRPLESSGDRTSRNEGQRLMI